MRSFSAFVAGASVVALSACSGSNGGSEPPLTRSAPANNVNLQLAVGVATFPDASQGLNVVATFRQANGNAATLVNTPTIRGPFSVAAPAGSGCPGSSYTAGLIGRAYLAGFAELGPDYSPAGAAGLDAGTHQISGSPQTPPGTAVACTTLGQAGGVFDYGLSLQNQTAAQTPNISPAYFFPQPLFGLGLQTGQPYLGGPPAYPNVQTGTYPAGFAGFTQGFLTFAIGAPPAGQYFLDVLVPASNAASSKFSTSAKLSSPGGLAPFAGMPVVTEDANAGGGLSVSFSAPAGVTENVVDIIDIGPNPASGIAPRTSSTLFYTVVTHGAGDQTVVLPPMLGPVDAFGRTSPSIAAGDNYSVNVIGADYPLFEAGPPLNTAAAPAIAGANGQADLTFAPVAGNSSTVGYASTTRSPVWQKRRR